MMTPALRTSCRFALPGLLDEANNLEFLSNIGADMLESAMRRHGHERVMEPPLSTDRVNAFKPSPKAYAMGPALRLAGIEVAG
jgi:2-haloacid dehalogenase